MSIRFRRTSDGENRFPILGHGSGTCRLGFRPSGFFYMLILVVVAEQFVLKKSSIESLIAL